MELSKKKVEPFEGSHFPFRVTYQKGQHTLTEPHWHEHIEMIKVLQGQVQIHINEDVYIAKKDDILFINSGCMHAAYTIKGSFAAIRGMVFDKSFLLADTNGFDTRKIYSFLLDEFHGNCLFNATHPIGNDISTLFDKIIEEDEQKELLYEMHIRSAIYQLIVILLRYCKNDVLGDELFSQVTQNILRLKPVLKYIDHHYSNKIIVEDLCATMNMSKYHFSRFFKEVMKKTPMEYVNQVRLNQAVRLMMESDLLMTEIAEKTGFCNVNYFGKKFKEKTGISPKQYKKRNKVLK